MDLYLQKDLSPEQRTEDLVSRMDLDEKVAQLGSTYADPLLENGALSEKGARDILSRGIGHISAIGRTSGLEGRKLASFSNDIQRFLMENTRLGVPAIIHEECLNGFRARGATIFPQNIGLAATWDTDLTCRITGAIRRQMVGTGIRQGLAPVLDVARDPRWGRMEETFGEDPFLIAAMGIAYVSGLQGDDPLTGVAATLKHFAGHGFPEGGLNCAPSHITPRLLRDIFLYPFEKVLRNAGALSLMNAYHELDGVPCGASDELLTGILRDEWGFTGLVVSDYYSVGQLITVHHICEDIGEAACLSLEAGIDLELPKSHGFAAPLKEQVKKGRISMELIDRAVGRVLELKFRLGLFDEPYADTGMEIDLDTPADRQLALEAARKSIVLLKNDSNLLPLDKELGSIAVIGPSADSLRNLLGDYTFPAGAGYELSTNQDTGKVEVEWKDREMLAGRISSPAIISVLEGIRKSVSDYTTVAYAQGCDTTGSNCEGFAEAVEAVRDADIAIVVLGGCSGMLPQCTSGEMRDSATLGLPGVQEELLKAVCDTGTPVVLVIINGRVNALGGITEKTDAVIYAWLPGEEGGRAVADVIFGAYNPGGKLPVSVPALAGQLPVYYSRKPSGGRSSLWGDYHDAPVKALFEFGFGLSYTTFEFSNLGIQPSRIPADGEVTVSCDVSNTGTRSGDEVAQLYINDMAASITRPVKELKGFERINLGPGEKKTVKFRLPASELAFHDRDMKRIVEPGFFRVMVGNSCEKIALEDEFEVTR